MIISPKKFDSKDLNFQVRLETCVGGNLIDFTGKQTYKFDLLREGIGFGMTDINIEVRPSLQPLVEITFKDFYGNTAFDRTGGIDNQAYHVLFRFPPPKFLFTFEGYLGAPVTWVLSLKKHNFSLDPTDGSYVIKASFVPNQWGFFADIPALYLLAIKGLKKDSLGSENFSANNSNQNPARAETFFDLIKIGKQVDIKSQQVTKRFDKLRNLLNGIRSNVLSTLLVSKLIDFGGEINGEVNGEVITEGDVDGQTREFRPIKIATLSDLELDRKELKSFFSRSQDTSIVNKFIILKSKFADTRGGNKRPSRVLGDYGINTFERFKKYLLATNPNQSKGDKEEAAKSYYESFGPTSDLNDNFNSDVNDAYELRMKAINSNLRLVEQAIQQSLYESSQTKLRQLTIGEVFSRLAGDSAYLLGRILEEGIKGFAENQGDRKGREKDLIGLNFPMEIPTEGVDKGKEIPAKGVGIDQYEMSFVTKFIEAITEGIARNQQSLDTGFEQDQNELSFRISNFEILKSNPYKANYDSIASNILERSGIASFVTRSSDPNLPGSFQEGLFGFGRDGTEDIAQMANSDFENITDSIIAELSSEQAEKLKRFCKFWDRLFPNDGSGLRNQNVSQEQEEPLALDENGDEIEFGYTALEPVSDEILNFNVLLDFDENGEAIDSTTVGEFMQTEVTTLLSQKNKELVQGREFQNNIYSLRKIKNNGIPYINGPENNTYYIVVFEGQDAIRAKQKQNAPTDIEFANENPDERVFYDLNQVESIYGVTSINQFTAGQENSDASGRIETFNEYLEDGDRPRIFSYSRMKDVYDSDFSNDDFDANEILWTKKIVQNPVGENETSAEGLAYAVVSHTNDVSRDVNRQLVWAPFLRSVVQGVELPIAGELIADFYNNSRNQRVFLKTICRNLLRKIRRIEEERRRLQANILGETNQRKDIIYKQFHTLFHTWNTLAFEDSEEVSLDERANKLCTPLIEVGNLATKLEEKYSNREDVTTPRDVVGDPSEFELESITQEFAESERSSQTLPDNACFRYEHPMNSVLGKRVMASESVINIDSLYRIKSNTTTLNIIQQICTKNNFIFIPIPGNGNYRDIGDIYEPRSSKRTTYIRNYFHVLFAPTPERRLYSSNGQPSLSNNADPENIQADAISVEFGSPDNQIIKRINVGTDENKQTAESIVNLQNLVDNDNSNKVIPLNCSVLPIMEGRSYTAKLDTLGNAQIYPMQFFYIRKNPIFGGLYQIMNVTHSIQANDFSTTFEGIKILQSSRYGGQDPITLSTLSQIQVLQPSVGNDDANEDSGIMSLYNDLAEQIQSLFNNDPTEVSETIGTERNGRIPESELTLSTALSQHLSGRKPFLIEEAATSFDRMISAFNRSEFPGKQDIIFTDGYRSYQRQKAMKEKYGKYAASPGTSKHGLGIAVDMFWGVKTKVGKQRNTRPVAYRHPNYRWFHENGYKFGWYNPALLRDDAGNVEEFWHWEYQGKKGPPSELPMRYRGKFDFKSDVEIIKRYDGIFKK